MVAWFPGYLTRIHRDINGKVTGYDIEYEIPEDQQALIEEGSLDESLYWDVELGPRNVRLNEDNPKFTAAMRERRLPKPNKGNTFLMIAI